MDYTNDPEANMQPDETNFQFLAQLYGEVGQTTSSSMSEESSTDTRENDEKNGERARRLKRRVFDRSNKHVPSSVVSSFESLDRLLDNGLAGAVEARWRKLHDSTHGEVHEIDAGDGFTIRIHVLKYVPPNA